MLALVACNAPKSDRFQIDGKIAGRTPTKAYLQLYEDGDFKTIDSSDFINGEFKFKGSVEFPDNYFIKIGQERSFINLFIENSNIKITAHIDSLGEALITGSKVQDAYNAFKEIKKPFESEFETLYTQYKAAEDKKTKDLLEAKIDSIDAVKNEYIKQWIMSNNASVLAPYIVKRELIYYLELEELESLTNSISPELSDYKYTQELFKRVEVLRSLQPGMPAPEFTQINPEGEPINLSDFKGKYLLVDFWASWCGPCRRANPTIVAMHNKYKNKGFTILGVSMDKNREKWLQAIEDDKLHWSQVSTLEGWANPVGKLYGVNSIPHAILIDAEGNIVKRGIHPNELDEILSRLLN